MTEKVKITSDEEQGIKEIESYLRFYYGTDHQDIQDRVKKALYFGYEVEPKFEIGNFVTDIHTGGTIKVTTEKMVTFLNEKYSNKSNVRLSTPKEIEQEKERRFWAKHGREVKEYRKGDIIKDSGNFGFQYRKILRIDGNEARCTGGIDIPLADLKLVCLNKNRLDRSETNE